MKKLLIGIMAILCLSSVLAFDPVFWLESTDRQEGRIENNWLIVEETNSHLDGYVKYYTLQDTATGYINVYYYGHDLIGKTHRLYDFINIYDGGFVNNVTMNGVTYIGDILYFNADHDYLGVSTDKYNYWYPEADVKGFYCVSGLCQGQIYLDFINTKGETWVTFLEGG